MKRISFLLFALALAVGCSSSTEPSDEAARADSELVNGGAPKLACADVGGQCVGLHYAACQGGTWADANAVTCGGGMGVGCCVKPQPPPPPPPPPPQTQCEAKGGRCTGVSPTSCPEGFFADADDFSCGSGVGAGCCLACPVLAPPPPGFCPDGTVEPRKDEAGCARGFDCVPNAKTECESKGGECVGLSPSSCVGGTWANASTHSCGSGIGVGCCLH